MILCTKRPSTKSILPKGRARADTRTFFFRFLIKENVEAKKQVRKGKACSKKSEKMHKEKKRSGRGRPFLSSKKSEKMLKEIRERGKRNLSYCRRNAQCAGRCLALYTCTQRKRHGERLYDMGEVTCGRTARGGLAFCCGSSSWSWSSLRHLLASESCTGFYQHLRMALRSRKQGSFAQERPIYEERSIHLHLS